MSPSATPLVGQPLSDAAHTSHYVVVSQLGASSDDPLERYSASSTGSLRSLVSRFYAVMAPMAVTAGLFAPADPRLIARSRSISETGVMTGYFHWFSDEWRYMPEYITEEQVEELRQLLALPVTTDLGFDSRGFAD